MSLRRVLLTIGLSALYLVGLWALWTWAGWAAYRGATFDAADVERVNEWRK